ncbi:hypothetical protein J437_LFUL003467 [Ladona fulva]|uniref:Uncharacterized protein n=1 Tax=Ladona fulva TaxID=123851 RepID=A0A8K0JX51_LADFU|nr:hypothetical protein J437_LFUL003467 [Ladona fulva]
MDVVDSARLAVQRNYAYFKVNREKNEVSVKKLLETYGIWSNNLKRDVLDFDKLNQDLLLKKSVDAYIGKAFSIANSETKVSSEDATGQIKNSIKRQNLEKIILKPPINHHVHEMNLDQGILHQKGKVESQKNDSHGDQSEIHSKAPRSISTNQNIISQYNEIPKTACVSKTRESRGQIPRCPECEPVKSKKKDTLLKSSNEFCMPAENVESKLISPMKKDLSSKWNICGQTNSSNEVAHSKTQLLNEKTNKVAHERVNFDASSDKVYGHGHPVFHSMNSYPVKSKNLGEQYKQQFIEGNKDNLYNQSEPLVAIKNQTSMVLTPGAQCNWQIPNLFHGQNQGNLYFPLPRKESHPLWPPSTHGNVNHLEYQFSPSDNFNWNTEGHLYYVGEDMNQPHDMNMYFWDPQSTVTWDLQNYPITSGLEHDFERRYELLPNYGGYFEPAETILQGRFRLDNSSELVQPQSKLIISSTDLMNQFR